MKHRTTTIFIAMAISFLLAACEPSAPEFQCEDTIGCVDILPGEPIKIAALQALSGSATVLGTTQRDAFRVALAHRQEQILDHPVELLLVDERCSPEGGTTGALKIVADPQIVAILGTSCSSAAETASQIMSDAGMVMISGLNTAPSLTAPKNVPGSTWQPGYFRAIYNGAHMAQGAAVFAYQELGIRSAATIEDGDIYTRELSDEFERKFIELGGRIVMSAGVNKGDTDMKPVLTALATTGTELIYFPLFQPEADPIIRDIQGITELKDVSLMTGGAIATDEFISSIGADGTGIYFTNAALPQGTAHESLLVSYVSRYGKPPGHHAYAFAYDATNLLLHAIEQAALVDDDGTLHIGREALRQTLYDTRGFEAVTGTLSCSQYGDCSAVDLVILQLIDPAGGLDGLRNNVVYTYQPE